VFEKFQSLLYARPEFKDVPFKVGVEQNDEAFWKLTIKVRKQIVADGLKKEDYEMIPSRFESIHEEIEEIVNQIIPFAKEHLQRVFPAKGEQSDSLFPESSFNDFIKLSHRHPLYEPTIHSPKLSSPYSNHYVLGPDLLSWLGTEGKVLTAQKAVDLIWKAESKRKKL